MFKQIAEFYGLYLERDLGSMQMVLGNCAGKHAVANMTDLAAFRAQCAAF